MSITATNLLATHPASWHDEFVLLVDDHEPSLRRLTELVRLSGFRCIPARSGSEAIRVCDQRRPKVVVTDLVMPNLGGLELARWLRDRHPSIPMILMTGQELDAARRSEFERIFSTVLTKPIDLDRLLRLIERLVARSGRWDAGRSSDQVGVA